MSYKNVSQKIQCFLFSAKELECGSTAEAPSWSGESDGMARQNQIARWANKREALDVQL